MKNLIASLAVIAALPVLGLAQLTTQSTTLTTAAVAASGANPPGLYNTLYVASTTGMLAQTSLGSTQTWLYVDHEAIPVVAVPTTTTVQVLRGDPVSSLGTSPAAHISGSVVYFGPYSNFVNGDPSGSCTSTNYQYLPLIAVTTGHLINCDAISSTASVFARTGDWYFINPAGCGMLATTVTTTDDGMVTLAAGNAIRKFVTNTTGGTTEITCPVNPPSSLLLSAKGVLVTGVSFLYGVQGSGGISSIAAATMKSITYATSTAAGAAAAGTVAAAGGTLTATPTSLQTAATTSGLFYNELVSLGNPFYANTNDVSLVFDQIITNSTTALTYQIAGLLVYYDEPL